MTIRCCTCKADKDETEFTKNKSRKTGRHAQCKKCRRKQHLKAQAKGEVWYQRNPLEAKKKHDEWIARNKDRYNAYMRNWNKANKDYTDPTITAYGASYRKSVREATPPWVDAEHRKKIVRIFTLAKRVEKLSGIKFNVDHIFPIQGKTCRGMHVWWNLRILPASENFRKNNKVIDSENIISPRASEYCFEEYLDEQYKMYSGLCRNKRHRRHRIAG